MVLLMTAIGPSFGLVSLLFVAIQAAGWIQNIEPLVYYHYGELETTYRFLGNESHKDHFKLLEKDQNSLLVGARNIVYNISLKDLTEFTDQLDNPLVQQFYGSFSPGELELRLKLNFARRKRDKNEFDEAVTAWGASRLISINWEKSPKDQDPPRIEWHASRPHREICTLKGKSEDDCQNYIRVLAKISPDKLLICGSNAYKPYCRYYRYKNGEYKSEEEFEGGGLCPYDPDHNSTAVYTDSQLYAATVADFQGGDPLIYREPLRTERSDLKQLNGPSFVGSMAYEDYVFFFFRETAVEYMNCGKKVYSRVARVCKHDKGGPHQFGDRWTSFLKSRLNCSVPGDYPFYFDEIQSMSEMIEGVYGQRSAQLLYGVFTTPINSIGGSAVCAFNMQSILDTFEGPFKEQETMNSNWLPVPISKVPEPRPGQCVNDSRTLPDVSVNFVKSHTLMDYAVPAFFSRPVLIRISSQYRFSMIAVDPQVRTPDGRAYDVLFIGTDDGKVVKAVNAASFNSDNKVQAVVLEEIQILPLGVPVKNLYVVHGNLIVLTDDEIQSIPVHRCDSDKVTSCSECVALQDPYCAWDVTLKRCVASGLRGWDGDKKRFLQSVTKGYDKSCPHTAEIPPVPTSSQTKTTGENDVYEEIMQTCPPCPVCFNEYTALPSLSEATTEAHQGSPHGQGRTPGHFTDADLNNEIIIELDESNVISDTLAGLSHPGAKLPSSQEHMVIYTAETLGIAVATSVVGALVVGFIGGFLFSRRCRSDDYSDMPRFPDNQRHQLNRLTDSGLNADLPQHINNKAINLVLNVPPKNANGKNANSSAENKPIQKVKKTYI